MKTFLKVLLHLAGFPLLIVLVVLESLPIIKLGMSYGVMVFVGIIFVVAMALIYFLVYFIMAKRNKKTVYKQTIASILIAVFCLGGVWLAIDAFVPNLLKDATSNTIFYEDLADNYYARAEVNKNLLDEYIVRNCNNGNLTKYSKEEYLKQGATNEEVMTLLKAHFQSIDKDGYVTFVGPWLDMANDDRLTIPTLVHLIINKRETEGLPYPLKEEDDPVMWSILDMLGEPMEFDLGEDGMDIIPQDYVGLINLAQKLIGRILVCLSDAIEDPNVVGSPIYISLEGGTVLTLTPSNESRGVLDYQNMGWLNSNGLIFMLVSLFSIRKLALIFAGVLAITTYMIGLLRDDKNKISNKIARNNKASYNQPLSPIINRSQLDIGMFKPYDPSFVVVSQGYDIDFNKMNKQLIFDADNNIKNRYDSKDFK